LGSFDLLVRPRRTLLSEEVAMARKELHALMAAAIT
jgi:hypothetical protein